MRKPKIVVIGGGTGTFTVLSGLKKYPLDLTAIVSMADDGGSTGILRDELGVLPPGDVRQCLVALSSSGLFLRQLMNYRFSEGTLKGHTFGNLFLSALEKTTGSFDKAIEKASEVLRLEGQVIPATLDKVRLVIYLQDKKIILGQSAINKANLNRLKKISLEPKAKANPKALKAIKEANLIIIGPGDLYSSLVPNLLVSGMSRAIISSRAKKIYICNLMTKTGHTDRFNVQNFVKKIENYLGGKVDYVIFNKERPSQFILKRYAREGEHFVESVNIAGQRYIGDNLINKKFTKPQTGDVIQRSLIRHNSDRLAKLIMRKIP